MELYKNAEVTQTIWFKELLEKEDYILLVAESRGKILGFIIGRLIKIPKFYSTDGFTLMVDDFCVASLYRWQSVGEKLVTSLKKFSQDKGSKKILVVCGVHDEPNRKFLKNLGLTITSECYLGELV